MPTDDDLGGEGLDLGEDGTGEAGLRTYLGRVKLRSARQADLIRALRSQVTTVTEERDTARTEATTGATSLEELAAAHATALEEQAAGHTAAGVKRDQQAALVAAGVAEDGVELVLSEYAKLGDKAPELGEWLKGEELPRHVQIYVGDGGGGGVGGVGANGVGGGEQRRVVNPDRGVTPGGKGGGKAEVDWANLEPGEARATMDAMGIRPSRIMGKEA